jgi:hypothetical protein
MSCNSTTTPIGGRFTPTYVDKMKRCIDFWHTDAECMVLRNQVHNLTHHHSNIHSYRYALTPQIQNTLKKFLYEIDEYAPCMDKPITYKLKDDLHAILNICNSFSIITSQNEEIIILAKQIQDSWWKLIASIQNLHANASLNI